MKTQGLIYVVDDNAFSRLLITTRLRRVTNAEVKPFESADSCLNAIESKVPDLIVSDYNLKHGEHKLNGNHLLVMIRESYPDLPVIIYSQMENMNMATELVHEGVTDVVFGHDRFIKRIANAVKNEINKKRNKYSEIARKTALVFSILLLSGVILSIYGTNAEVLKYFAVAFMLMLFIVIFFGNRLKLTGTD
jgi:DNA-binding NtrC family response regulator